MAEEEAYRLTGAGKKAAFLGLRVSALREILVFIGVVLIIDILFGASDRFAGLRLHPFWIVVLLSSTYYGTNEGLLAAALSTAALLGGNVPDQVIGEDLAAWLFRMTAQPVLWFVAALVLGEISVARRQEAEQLREELQQIHAQVDVVTRAYEQTTRSRELLEMHIASQQRTVRSLAAAAQAIEQPSEAEVLRNVPGMVRAVLSPEKFSLFLAKEMTLELLVEEGWEPNDQYWRRIAQGPLHEAIMDRRETLTVSDPVRGEYLCGQGLMAAPVIEGGTGRLIGMLKIEKACFYDLNLSTIMDFKALCDWIGRACERANRLDAYGRSLRFSDGLPEPHDLRCEVEHDLDDNILLHMRRDWPRSANTIAPKINAGVPDAIQMEIDAGYGRKPATKRRNTT